MLDVRGWRRGFTPFIWIGMNAIVFYLLGAVVDLRKLAARFVGGDIQAWLNTHVAPDFGDLFLGVVALTFAILFMRFLYRRGIFIRV
ncbi:MAG: hypothetical protein ABI680_13115 [Chthoniobacteraceae bacterium]